MRTIMTIADINVLKQSNVFPPSFMEFLESEFQALAQSFGGNPQDPTFSLRPHGYMVVLEQGDNCGNLSCVNGGLLSSMPEYVELVKLADVHLNKIAIYTDNDYMIFLYSEVGIHAEEIEDWLSEQISYEYAFEMPGGDQA